MATPITHIVLTEKIFDKFFKEKNKEEFFIGTSFPDIRYLKVIDREKTHYKDISVASLKTDDSFFAGLKFHSILDVAREKFMVDNDVYSLCPESKYTEQSLKILEDEVLYSYFKNWEVQIEYLNKILPAEKNYGISEKDLIKWHELLQQYFKEKPNKDSVRDFIINMGLTEEIVDEVNNNVAIMRENKKIVDIIKKLYQEFDNLLEK